RPARLSYTGAGWASLTYVIPANSAVGPAEVALMRTDGSKATTKVIIANVAPGFWTASADGRGAVIGRVTQRFANGSTKTFPVWECAAGVYGCRTVPIALSAEVSTTVRLDASGIRYANPKAVVRVTVGDVAVPVLGIGAGDDAGRVEVTARLRRPVRRGG